MRCAAYGASEHKYRFAWTYPIVISPHDPNTLYIGGNLVFKITDEGQSWQPISPDLTRADPETLKPTGGPVNLRRDRRRDLRDRLCLRRIAARAGRALGRIGRRADPHHPRRRHGAGHDITPTPLARMDADQLHRALALSTPGTAYVAATRYKLDDYEPYLYVTRDYGQTWARDQRTASRTIDFTRVIRADPAQPGLLYRRHRDRTLRLVRRRRELAALPAQSAGHADPRIC